MGRVARKGEPKGFAFDVEAWPGKDLQVRFLPGWFFGINYLGMLRRTQLEVLRFWDLSTL